MRFWRTDEVAREAGRLGERTTEIGSEDVAEDAGPFVTGDQNTSAGAFPTEDSSIVPENVDADMGAVDVFCQLDKRKDPATLVTMTVTMTHSEKSNIRQ